MKRVIRHHNVTHLGVPLVFYLDYVEEVRELLPTRCLGSLFRGKALDQPAIFIDLDDVANRDRRYYVALVTDARDPPLLRQAVASFADGCTAGFTSPRETGFS